MEKVAVLSGPERRRRWTSAEKLRIVEESLASEASVAEVARRHEVHPNLLHVWRRQARAGALGCAVERAGALGGEAHFAAVAVVPEGLALPAPAQPAAAGVIEIELASGARLRITGAVEPATVSAVIASLAGARR
jgi:transposase